MVLNGSYSKMSKNYEKDSVKTPKFILEYADRVLGKGWTDPCPYNPAFDKNKDKDGLTTDWGKNSYCNPPYSEMKKWVLKGYTEYTKGSNVIMLVKVSTLGTKYFRESPGARVVFFQGRIPFPGFKYLPKFPSCLLVWKAGHPSSEYSFFDYNKDVEPQ